MRWVVVVMDVMMGVAIRNCRFDMLETLGSSDPEVLAGALCYVTFRIGQRTGSGFGCAFRACHPIHPAARLTYDLNSCNGIALSRAKKCVQSLQKLSAYGKFCRTVDCSWKCRHSLAFRLRVVGEGPARTAWLGLGWLGQASLG